MEKLKGLHWSPKGNWKLSLRPGLLVSHTEFLWVINVSFVSLHADSEGAMRMGVDALGAY